MSMLGEQIKKLHEMADAMHRRSRDIGLDYGMGRGLADASRMLREAADTIESLRDKLQELQGVGGESRYTELFGTPERTAKTLSIMQRCELGIIGNCDECEMHDACRVRDGDYDALLGWLRGESE